MARTLSAALDNAMLGEVRRPGYKVEIFDVRSTSKDPTPTRINDVVLYNVVPGTSIPTIVGPRDFTDDVEFVEISEVAGDYVREGLASSNLTLRIVDADGSLDPLDNPPTAGDPEADGRWLRQGNVIVVREGDLSVDDSFWPITFTGAIRGQAGQDRNRTTNTAFLTAKASSREVDFVGLLNTSRNFAQNTTFEAMANELAEVDMGLELDEVDFPTFSARFTKFAQTQFVEESPLASIAKIMLVDGFLPRFAGDGRLTATSASLTKSPARVYTESELQTTVTRPIVEDNGVNEVEVIGLDPTMSRVDQQRQTLATASITTGFFTRKAKIPVSWSGDKTQQARGARMEVDASIGDSLFTFGSESFTDFTLADGSSVEGLIEVDGALGSSLALVGLVAVVWIAEGFIPDLVVTAGVGASTGTTISVGRALQSITGQILFSILAHQGRGQYRITGLPFEHVFREIRSVARIAGVAPENRKNLTIENHLINSTADADAIAERVLREERAKQNDRSIDSLVDLKLEPNDVIQLGEGITGRRYMLTSIARRIARDGRSQARLRGYEITTGVRP